MPSDKDYKSAKKIKQGISVLDKEFESLVEWIDGKYDVKTLYVFFDHIHKNKSHPRLQICLEYAKDKSKFIDTNTYDFDKKKQKEIAEKFEEYTSFNQRIKPSILKKLFKFNKRAQKLHVYFTDFESIAKIEANISISEKEIETLKKNLNNPEVWEVSKGFFGVTYFFCTDEQLKKYQDSELHKKWSEQYFELLENYDEFSYFKKDLFSIYLDSKENFDNNYESNWYYYYK